jgi:hypothetical protein
MTDLTATYDLVVRLIILGQAVSGLAILLASKYYRKKSGQRA